MYQTQMASICNIFVNHATSTLIVNMSVSGKDVRATFSRTPSPSFTISRAGYDFTANDSSWAILRKVFLSQFPSFQGTLSVVDNFYSSDFSMRDTSDFEGHDDDDSTYAPSEDERDDYAQYARSPVKATKAVIKPATKAKPATKSVKAAPRSMGERRSARIASRH